MISSSDIQTYVRYDKPYPGYVEVESHLEVHSVTTVREKDPVRQQRFIEDAKHLTRRDIWKRVYNLGDLYAHTADLEHVALMSPFVKVEEVKEITRKIHEILEGWK